MSAQTREPLRIIRLRPADLVPETIPIQIQREGRSVTLRGHVLGDRTLGSIKAAAHSVFLAWSEAQGKPGGPSYADRITYHTDLLLAVVEGLDYTEADLLAADSDQIGQILYGLGWWQTEPGDESPPPVGEESTTTASSSPGSRRSTASARKSGSRSRSA